MAVAVSAWGANARAFSTRRRKAGRAGRSSRSSSLHRSASLHA